MPVHATRRLMSFLLSLVAMAAVLLSPSFGAEAGTACQDLVVKQIKKCPTDHPDAAEALLCMRKWEDFAKACGGGGTPLPVAKPKPSRRDILRKCSEDVCYLLSVVEGELKCGRIPKTGMIWKVGDKSRVWTNTEAVDFKDYRTCPKPVHDAHLREETGVLPDFREKPPAMAARPVAPPVAPAAAVIAPGAAPSKPPVAAEILEPFDYDPASKSVVERPKVSPGLPAPPAAAPVTPGVAPRPSGITERERAAMPPPAASPPTERPVPVRNPPPGEFAPPRTPPPSPSPAPEAAAGTVEGEFEPAYGGISLDVRPVGEAHDLKGLADRVKSLPRD